MLILRYNLKEMCSEVRQHYKKLLAFLILSLIFHACSINGKAKNLDNWIGKYEYGEEPIKAVAGYYMILGWELSIYKTKNEYQGVLDVNGQQTFMKLLSDIVGDTNSVAIIYNSLIDGSVNPIKKGDTLFTLSKRAGGIETNWFAFEPILAENPPKKCNCFMRVK